MISKKKRGSSQELADLLTANFAEIVNLWIERLKNFWAGNFLGSQKKLQETVEGTSITLLCLLGKRIKKIKRVFW